MKNIFFQNENVMINATQKNNLDYSIKIPKV